MIKAVPIANTIKVMTATREENEREERPQIPWPEVQPLDSLEPNPTKIPPTNNWTGPSPECK